MPVPATTGYIPQGDSSVRRLRRPGIWARGKLGPGKEERRYATVDIGWLMPLLSPHRAGYVSPPGACWFGTKACWGGGEKSLAGQRQNQSGLCTSCSANGRGWGMVELTCLEQVPKFDRRALCEKMSTVGHSCRLAVTSSLLRSLSNELEIARTRAHLELIKKKEFLCSPKKCETCPQTALTEWFGQPPM